ncbi:MAG: hypothetical protein JNK63_00120 [Chthonomonas sp.]|nr:hypothetical protein [Chthonomonas sp.]
MKRLIVFASLTALIGSAFAQSSFTIRRPLEGAKVRETVEVRIPVRSIPAGAGFVGIWVNGRFLEAVSPYYPSTGVNTTATDFIYKLDTKKKVEPHFPRGIPDGQMTIEAVLYVNRGSFTQPVNKSSVVVQLDNSASIRIPSGGLVLRYPFRPLSEFVYGIEFKNSIQNLTEAQAQLGSQAGTVEGQPERFRYRVTVMNQYRNSDGTKEGLLLMQPLVMRGQDHAMLTTSGNGEPDKYYDYNMAPLYMRVANNGREIFGAWPFYAPNGQGFSEAGTTDLIAMLPLPILPSRGVRPGGPAFTGYLPQAVLDLENGRESNRFTQLIQARGTLEGIEYERGRPCAKIRNVLAQGQAATGIMEFEEYYWFALDLGMPLKIERRYTMTTRVRENVGGGGGGAGGGQGGGPPLTRPDMGGGGGDGREGGRRMGRSILPGLPLENANGTIQMVGPGLIFGPKTFMQARSLGGQDMGANGQGGGPTGGNQNNQNQGRTRTRLVRQRTVITMTME